MAVPSPAVARRTQTRANLERVTLAEVKSDEPVELLVMGTPRSREGDHQSGSTLDVRRPSRKSKPHPNGRDVIASSCPKEPFAAGLVRAAMMRGRARDSACGDKVSK